MMGFEEVMQMDDLISRQAVLSLAKDVTLEGGAKHRCVDATEICLLPSAQRKGKWLEKEVISVYENGFQLQSCKCSECGRYDTSPYVYYFSEPNFCSYCGADIRGEQNETDER